MINIIIITKSYWVRSFMLPWVRVNPVCGGFFFQDERG